jgi:hypothetical protein
MWTDVHFPLPNEAEVSLFGSGGRSPTLFRKSLAALNMRYSLGLPPEFFGYKALGLANDTGETTIGIGTFKNGLRLVAVGSQSCELLQDRAPLIHSALIRQTNELVAMNVRSGEHGFEILPYERSMVIRNLCVGHARSGDYWYGAAEKAQKGESWMHLGERKIPNYLIQCIMTQGRLLAQNGDDCPGGLEDYIIKAMPTKGSWSDSHSELKSRLAIKLHSVAGHTWVKRDKASSLVVLKDVEFTIRANLSGPWFAGRMKIEARGEFLNATRQASQEFALATEAHS